MMIMVHGKLDVVGTHEVRYKEREDVPGLYIRTGCTMTSVILDVN